MTRIRPGLGIPPRESGVTLDLIVGPTEGELTVEQLELAWEAYGAEVMRDCSGVGLPGTRPWGYWRFELREDRPDGDGEPIRLAELGLLRDEEIAAIAERANVGRTRIGTTAEHISGDGRYRPDVLAVELHEAVKRALGQIAREETGHARPSAATGPRKR
jgi:hypothetical protein